MKICSQPQNLHDNLVYIFAQANQRVHKDLERRLKKDGMQVNHWRILEVLSDQNPHSMGELATQVLMNHPTLTKMLDRIIHQGLIARELDKLDNRRVLVSITPKGLELYHQLQVHARDCHYAFEQRIGTKKWEELKVILNEVINQ